MHNTNTDLASYEQEIEVILKRMEEDPAFAKQLLLELNDSLKAELNS